MPTALIVEDEPEANKLLAILVQIHGYRTETAFSGAQALDQAGRGVPDVVLLDLMLPDLDGYQVCQTLKSSPATCRVPVIIVTARVAAENRIRCFAAGANDYVAKPFTPDQLYQALDRTRSCSEWIDAKALDGRVALDRRDNGDTLWKLAQLRDVMLARFGRQAATPVATAIAAIWSKASAWAVRSETEQVASLTYTLAGDTLSLSLECCDGFLPAPPRRIDPFDLESLGNEGFDRVVFDEDARCVTFRKVFRGPGEPDS